MTMITCFNPEFCGLGLRAPKRNFGPRVSPASDAAEVVRNWRREYRFIVFLLDLSDIGATAEVAIHRQEDPEPAPGETFPAGANDVPRVALRSRGASPRAINFLVGG